MFGMFGYLRAVKDMAQLVTQVQLDNVSLREELARERTARYFALTRMAELKTEQAGVLADLRSRLTIAQANFEWLSAMHNQAAAERSQLMLERRGVAVPAATIAMRRDRENAPSSYGQPLEDPPGNVAEMVAQNDFFDDMGNQAAQAQGIASQTYDDPTALLREN